MKWNCTYNIFFVPRYWRKVFYDIGAVEFPDFVNVNDDYGLDN